MGGSVRVREGGEGNVQSMRWKEMGGYMYIHIT